jgi:hypothetical protein
MEEIAETKAIAFSIVLRFDIGQILLVIDKIVDGMFFLSLVQEVSDLLGRVEFRPVLVRDSRIR